MADIVIAGVQFPFLLALLAVSGMLHLVLDRLLARLGVYGRIWHPGLFRVAVFAGIFVSSGLIFCP